jgi:hypothetical protein
MGERLTDADEGLHPVGAASNWNESRYVDFWDAAQGIGGWFRMGQRPNEGHAEMSACLYLPDGTVAFDFVRAPVTANSLTAGPLTWGVPEPWRANTVSYRGDMILLADPWVLRDPKVAFKTSPRAPVSVELTCATAGVDAAIGWDQDHVGLIFLPGQGDHHYQHLAHVTGTATVGERRLEVDGRGGKDHSWGPRNWHAKRWLRWLTCSVDDGNGFMLTRSVGPTEEKRSGYALVDGEFAIVDSFTMENAYGPAPNHEVRGAEVTIRAGGHEITATGVPRNWLPLRHRQKAPDGGEALLRIVKSPTEWTYDDGRTGTGALEYHDLMVDDVPVALHE